MNGPYTLGTGPRAVAGFVNQAGVLALAGSTQIGVLSFAGSTQGGALSKDANP